MDKMNVLVNNCCGCRVAAVKTIVVEVVEWLRVSWGWCVCSMIHAAKRDCSWCTGVVAAKMVLDGIIGLRCDGWGWFA
jgi:hypothetical protein